MANKYARPLQEYLARVVWTPPASVTGADPDWPTSRLSSLSYSIGVLLKGDGSVFMYKKKGKKRRDGTEAKYSRFAIQLQVGSLDFANYFNLRFSETSRSRPVSIRGPDKIGMFFVTYGNHAFGTWWKLQNLDSLKPYIEAFPIDYLRGRFDSEANVNAGAVTLFGADDHREQMKFDRNLCAKLGMRVGKLRVYCRIGTRSYIGDRPIITTMKKVRFGVNAKDFLRVVGGLNVKERDARLKSMIKGRAWTPWSTEIRLHALGLSKEGISSKEIAARLKTERGVDVPPMTIYFWARRGTKSWSEFAESRQ